MFITQIMLTKLKLLFNPNSIDNLKLESESILDIFTITVNDLKEVNKRTEDQVQKRENVLAETQRQIWDLKTIQDSNTKVIDKINKILE